MIVIIFIMKKMNTIMKILNSTFVIQKLPLLTK